MSRLCGCWSRAEYQQPSSDSLSWATALGTRGGWGLTSMFNRKGREGGKGGNRWRDLEAVLPLQAVYSGARDSQLILFTFYSLWDFRVCMGEYTAVCVHACVCVCVCVCVWVSVFVSTESPSLSDTRQRLPLWRNREERGSWLSEVMKPYNKPSHLIPRMTAVGIPTPFRYVWTHCLHSGIMGFGAEGGIGFIKVSLTFCASS